MLKRHSEETSVDLKGVPLKKFISDSIEQSLQQYFYTASIPGNHKNLISVLKRFFEISLFQDQNNFSFKQMNKLLQMIAIAWDKDTLSLIGSLITNAVGHDDYEFLRVILEEDKSCKQCFRELDISGFLLIAPTHLPKNDLFYYAIANNSLNTVHLLRTHLDWKINFSHLETAVENFSEDVFNYLLKNYTLSEEEREKLSIHAKNFGNITVLNQLQESAHIYFFKDILDMIDKSEEVKSDDLSKKIFNRISRAYRFTLSIKEVDGLCEKFLQHLSTLALVHKKITIITSSLKNARKEYLKWGSVIAPYRKPDELKFLSKSYNSPLYEFDDKYIEHEIKFGSDNYKLVEELLDKESKLGASLSFDEIMDFINDFNGKSAQERKLEKKDEFGTYREGDAGKLTVLKGRYDVIFSYLKATYENINQIPDAQLTENGYELLYKDKTICNIEFGFLDTFDTNQSCIHGQTEKESVLPEIRKLHNELCAMENKEINENPKVFYNKIARVLSLIGKLTPYDRGTGRLVETWLAFIHAKKGLHCPILKKVQLDCINISQPTSIEEQLLLYFFKRESLTEEAQKYIDNLSQHEATDRLLSKYHLGKYETQTISDTEIKAEFSADEKIIEKFLKFQHEKHPDEFREQETRNLLKWISKNKPDLMSKIAVLARETLSAPDEEKIDIDILLNELKKNDFNKIPSKSFISLKPATDIITISFDDEKDAKKFTDACSSFGANSQYNKETKQMYGQHPLDPTRFVVFISKSQDMPIIFNKTNKKNLKIFLEQFNGKEEINSDWELTFKDEQSANEFIKLHGKDFELTDYRKRITVNHQFFFFKNFNLLLTSTDLQALNKKFTKSSPSPEKLSS
jgi:hypothetical protein